MMAHLSPAQHDLLASRVGIDPDDYTEALTGLAAGTVSWVVVSGKMTAGKDTIAPEMADVMPTVATTGTTMLRYGNLMRAELDPALDLLRARLADGTDLALVSVEIADLMSLPLTHARTLVEVLAPEMVASGGTLTAHSRTEGVRRILINLGDSWRCANDADYWARTAARAALDELNAGKSVILTGGRFAPDVDLPRAAGAFLLRLDVTEGTQLARLAGRDGIAVSDETLDAMRHVSETELDDYPHFDARIDNDADLTATVGAARTAFTTDLAWRQRYAA